MRLRLYTGFLLLLTVLALAAGTPTYPQCAVCTMFQTKTQEKKKLMNQLNCKQDTSCLDTSCLCTANEALSSCITANCTTREDLSMQHHHHHHHTTTSRLSGTNWKLKKSRSIPRRPNMRCAHRTSIRPNRPRDHRAVRAGDNPLRGANGSKVLGTRRWLGRRRLQPYWSLCMWSLSLHACNMVVYTDWAGVIGWWFRGVFDEYVSLSFPQRR